MRLTLEVVELPVTDVDMALAFYTEQAGFVLDVDYRPTPDFRVVQLTPPGSAASIHLVTRAGNSDLVLVTTDLAADHAELRSRGIDIGPIRHKDDLDNWSGGYEDGLDPDRRDYASFADFADPDGNTWTLQERGHHNREGK